MLGSIALGIAAPEPALTPYRMLAFGGSAGAIPALMLILGRLPVDFPIAIAVILHLPADADSRLPDVLAWKTGRHCKWAEDTEMPAEGRVYVAPPAANLTLTGGGRFAVSHGPKPLLGWPSIDIFFDSMACHLGPLAIGVVLSGSLHDGCAGIAALRRHRAVTLVQDPALARYPDMPRTAFEIGKAELKLSLAGITEAVQILAECGVP